MPTPAVTVVIPTINEAENIPYVLSRLPDWIDQVLIIDGGSTDATVALCREFCPRAEIIIERRRGKGVALLTGFEHARGDFIVAMDADGSTDPAEIPAFVGMLMAGYDLAKGSRFLQGGGTGDMEMTRRLGNRALTLLVRACFGGRYTDLCYGYFAFRRSALPELLEQADEVTGFEIETFLNVRALRSDLRVAEVASYEAARLHGESNLRTLPDGFRVLRTIGRQLMAQLCSDPVREFEPADVVCIDLATPISSIETERRRLYALVRLGAEPVGTIEIDSGLSNDTVAQLLWARFADDINRHLTNRGLAPVMDLPIEGIRLEQKSGPDGARTTLVESTTAIVIATHDRPAALDQCLRSITTLTVAPSQVVVVDSAPGGHEAAEVVESWRSKGLDIEYVLEKEPGLAVAHNAGLQMVRSDLVAFTDDDVIVDRYWLEQLNAAFDENEAVGCVTGMILPAQLETWSQQLVEWRIGYNKGFVPKIFDLEQNCPPDPLFPFAAGAMGSGANMAFRTKMLRELGGFDRALGAGTTALGGDDLRAFYSVVSAGHAVAYQPSAIVFHHHPRDEEAMARQAYSYGVGLTAYLTSVLAQRPASALPLARQMTSAMRRVKEISLGPTDRELPRRRRMALRQGAGMVIGPFKYARSVKRSRP